MVRAQAPQLVEAVAVEEQARSATASAAQVSRDISLVCIGKVCFRGFAGVFRRGCSYAVLAVCH